MTPSRILNDRRQLGFGFECPLDLDGQPELADALASLDLVEIIPEGFFHGKRAPLLKTIGDLGVPVVVHSVDMSLGTDGPFPQAHFDAVRRVIDAVNCAVFSDHICMTRAGGVEIGQLTTLPFTEAAADAFCRNVDVLQRQLGPIPFMAENITNRFVAAQSTMTEPEFINKVTRRTGIGLLLDLTNVYTNALNFGFDPRAWIGAIDLGSIAGIHLAGGEWDGGKLYDTHSQAVPDDVWELYQEVAAAARPRAVIVEWDQRPPPVRRLLEEVRRAAELAGLTEEVCVR